MKQHRSFLQNLVDFTRSMMQRAMEPRLFLILLLAGALGGFSSQRVQDAVAYGALC